MGDAVIKFDKVRPPLYHVARKVFGSGNNIHIVAVDPHVNTNLWGVLRPLAPEVFCLETTSIAPKVLKGHDENGFYEDSLYFLDEMHIVNISFLIDDSGFSLAPIYDMCAIGFLFKSTGEIPPLGFSLPDIGAPLSFMTDTIPMIKEMARIFWSKLGESELISEELKIF